jgi:putative salt-induced outer membrane protein YdiY
VTARRRCWALLAFVAAAAAHADTVHLDNGDRLSGEVAEAADAVTVVAPGIGAVRVPRERVAHIERSEPDAQPPRPAKAWDISIDLALVAAAGNTETDDFNFNLDMVRSGSRFDHVVGVAAHKAAAQQTTTDDQFDANYDLRWKYREAWYAVLNFEYFRDPIKDVPHRYTAGAGAGLTLWDTPRGALNTDFGISQVFEELGALRDTGSNPALRWSLTFNRWLVPERWELFHNNQLLRILAEGRGGVWDSDTGLRFHLNSRWQAGLRLDLQHETAPAAGRKRTDARYGVTLGAKL